MSVPARFKWLKEEDRFAAYPVGSIMSDRLVWIAPYHPVYQSWKWVASWEGWFTDSGIAAGKQEAADRATEAWWKMVQTEVPRDVDFDATRIVAQVLVRPIPNSLFSEDGAFLQTVLWHLKNVFREDIAAGVCPVRVVDLVEQLQGEIETRITAGELARKVEHVPQKMRRRRR